MIRRANVSASKDRGESMKRREFLWIGGGLAAAGIGGLSRPARTEDTDSARADLILINGRVYTMDDDSPRAEAFAVHRGRFIAAGSTDDILDLYGPANTLIDAEGMTIAPGFIDAHSHPDGVEEVSGVDVNLPKIADIQAALHAKAGVTPLGHWVTGYKYDDTKLADGRPVNRQDLDEAVPDHPAKIGHRGGHTGVFNSKAFEIAGITAETPDPPGGRFYRQSGKLTGKVAELALNAFDAVGEKEPVTRETRQAGVEFISAQMAAAGLTSVTNAWGSRDELIAYQDARAAGTLKFRLVFMPYGEWEIYAALRTAGLRTGFGDEDLKIGAVKFAADGSASERTMRMSTPYVGRPDDYGILTMTQEEIHEAVEEAHRNGFQVGIHANGDVAIDMVLNAYERVQQKWPRADTRHRIEHCSLINKDLLRRIKAAGAIPTPFYTYVHYHGNKWLEYGDEKMRSMFAHRSFLDYDIPVAPASDYMPGPFEPLMAIQSMVTRKDFAGRVWGPEQRISVAEALRICTRNGAYASFEENLKGSISPGKLADFVILAEDPHQVDRDRIKDIQIVRTVLGGKTVYEG